jgi:hypothetical protein
MHWKHLAGILYACSSKTCLRPGLTVADAPQIFGAVGTSENDTLLITGFFGVVKVVACGTFVLFLVERIGRKWSLALGAFMMGALMLIVAILAKVFTPDSTATEISSPTAASIAMIYLEAASYNMSWVC